MTDERLVTLSEVKALLEKAEEDRGELTYEQKLALEHARKFARFTLDEQSKLLKELEEIEGVEHEHAVRVVDFAPTHADDVRAIFAKLRVNLDDAHVQKILETVAKYVKE